MKKVVNIIGLVPQIVSVPDDYMRCSVSGEMRPKSEFCNDLGVFTSTNCLKTYMMPPADMVNLDAQTKSVIDSVRFKQLTHRLRKEQEYISCSIPIDDMIESLRKLKSISPTARLCIMQEGYYADGAFADIYNEPEFKIQIDDVKYYSLGISVQNY